MSNVIFTQEVNNALVQIADELHQMNELKKKELELEKIKLEMDYEGGWKLSKNKHHALKITD